MSINRPKRYAIVRSYHQQTKHHSHRYARSPEYLDWDNQPLPYRLFEGAPRIQLPLAEKDRDLAYSALYEAIEGSPDSSTIHIQVKEQNNWVTIKVIDNGSGIPEYAKKKTCSRFYSVPHPETGKRGNGLGLRFAKKIMTLHGGTITVANRAMLKGAEAMLRFPLKHNSY